MNIRLTKVRIRDLFEGYDNQYEDGVVGFGGKLDIRPKFQREFIYNAQQRDAVIESIMFGYPISVMYWLKNESNGMFELMDGQQRTISICEYVEGNYAVNNEYFFKLPEDQQNKILDYPLLVYVVQDGTDEENLAWFRKINTAGEKLMDQEIRNAVYTGPWTTDAKKYFAKTFCPAIKLGENYLVGSPIRQDYLETVLDWISNHDIDNYMKQHHNDENAAELWEYFENVIRWVKTVFPTYRKEMKGVEWGILYNQYKDVDTTDFDKKFDELYDDEEIENKRGIFNYLFDNDTKHLKIVNFPNAVAKRVWKAQGGKCAICGEELNFVSGVPVRIKTWENGGRLDESNCKVICNSCNYSYIIKEGESHFFQRERTENGILRKLVTVDNNREEILTKGVSAANKVVQENYVDHGVKLEEALAARNSAQEQVIANA